MLVILQIDQKATNRSKCNQIKLRLTPKTSFYVATDANNVLSAGWSRLGLCVRT